MWNVWLHWSDWRWCAIVDRLNKCSRGWGPSSLLITYIKEIQNRILTDNDGKVTKRILIHIIIICHLKSIISVFFINLISIMPSYLRLLHYSINWIGFTKVFLLSYTCRTFLIFVKLWFRDTIASDFEKSILRVIKQLFRDPEYIPFNFCDYAFQL